MFDGISETSRKTPVKKRRKTPALRAVAPLIMAVAILVPGAPAHARSCGTSAVGTAHFSQIRAEGVGCSRARRLLDRTTLAKNRGGNVFWYYGGWRWSIQGRDEMSNVIRGKRGKTKRIRAIWSAT